MANTARSTFAFVTLFLTACGPDLTSSMVGTYRGSIVADAVVDPDYTVTVAAVDNDTIAISGADFETFEVDVMSNGSLITHIPNDPENTLAYDEGMLEVVHGGADGSVTFSGEQVSGEEAGGDSAGGGGEGGEGGGNEDSGNEGGTDTDSAASIAAGTYTGSITGPVLSVNYVLTVTVIDAETIEVSGPDITPFEVPLVVTDRGVEESGVWEDGSFSLVDDNLSIVHDPQNLSFTGSRN